MSASTVSQVECQVNRCSAGATVFLSLQDGETCKARLCEEHGHCAICQGTPSRFIAGIVREDVGDGFENRWDGTVTAYCANHGGDA